MGSPSFFSSAWTADAASFTVIKYSPLGEKLMTIVDEQRQEFCSRIPVNPEVESSVVADTNMAATEALDESEQEAMTKANRERAALREKLCDPDDCHLDVRQR